MKKNFTFFSALIKVGMARTITISLLSSFCLAALAQPAKKAGKSRLVYDGTNYYGLFKPADSTTGVHHVIFCANGAGEQGTTNSAGGSLGAHCKAGASMQFANAAKGGYSTFFVVEVYDWNAGGIFNKLPTAIAYAKSTLGALLDTTQMYYMGLSLSGGVAGLIADDTAGLGKRFAGVLGCSPVYEGATDHSKIFAGLAKTHLFGAWIDANNDPNSNTNWVMQQYVEFDISGYSGTPVPKLYIPNGAANVSRHQSNGNYGGHNGGWYLGMDTLTQIWDLDSSKFPGHSTVTNVPVTVTNMYEQFLSYQRAGSTNQLPVANAGPDKSLLLPTNSITLDGTGSYDPDGSIVSYLWTKLTGGSASITNSTAITTTVTGLTTGHYSFQLKVTDNAGGFRYDTMSLYVNQKPVASIAGNPITITLPLDSVLLNGSGSTDDDGIQSYAWSKMSGPGTPTIATPSTASTKVTSLVAGVYVFRLIVSDWGGAKDTAQITVNVNTSSNVSPIANAGADDYIVLPLSTITLNATNSSDPDGSIVSWLWTKISGGSGTITSTTSATTSVTGLISGHYYFQIKVTDNANAFSFDTMHVYVNQKPVANIAGNPITITLPVDSVLLNGSGSTDDDGIQTYAWSKISGAGSQTIVTPSANTTKVKNLTAAGAYVFRLIVSDYAGANDTTQVTINVNANGGRMIAALPELKFSADSSQGRGPLKLSMYPNPVQSQGTITYNSADNSMKSLNVYTAGGILISKNNWSLTKGVNTFYLKSSFLLKNGSYILILRDSNGKAQSKLIFIKM